MAQEARRAASAGQAMRTSLAVVEVALPVILLSGSVLVIRGFTGLMKIDPGSQRENKANQIELYRLGDEGQYCQ